jgi:hypothetical protein
VQDKLLADDPELECTKECQVPFNGQDPYDGAIKLLAAVYDGELERNDSMDGGPKEDSDVISASQGLANDRFSFSSHDACSGSYSTPGVGSS